MRMRVVLPVCLFVVLIGGDVRTCARCVIRSKCGSVCLFSGASDGIRKRVVLDLFSNFEMGNIQWSLRHTCECSLTRPTFCVDAFTVYHLRFFFSRVDVCCAMVSGEVFCTNLFLLFPEEAAADDILMGAQPPIMCWTRAQSSSSELVETATARRRHREEDAVRVGTAVPISPRTARPRSTERRHEVAWTR